MTAQRDFEKRIWNFLYGYVYAATPEELGQQDYEEMSTGDQNRYDRAVQRVSRIVGHHF